MNIKCWLSIHKYTTVKYREDRYRGFTTEQCSRCGCSQTTTHALNPVHRHPICGHVEGSDTCWQCTYT